MATATVENGASAALPASWRWGDLALTRRGAENHDDIGPIQAYDQRVAEGLLRDDEHQRGERASNRLPAADLATPPPRY